MSEDLSRIPRTVAARQAPAERRWSANTI